MLDLLLETVKEKQLFLCVFLFVAPVNVRVIYSRLS